MNAQQLHTCEYCGDGTPTESRVWRKVVNHDDGTRREVWCCDECYCESPEDAGEVLQTEVGDRDRMCVDCNEPFVENMDNFTHGWVSTKCEVCTGNAQQLHFLVEWNGDNDREEFSTIEGAVDYATHIISGGYEGYICIEECDGDGSDQTHWSIRWEYGEKECDE